MDTQDRQDDQGEDLFLRRESAGNNRLWYLLGGVGALGLGAVGFAAALVTRVDQLSLHAMTTLPILLGISALTIAWSLTRTPRQVAVGRDGLRIEGQRERQSYDWSRIGWATVGTTGMNQRRQLLIYDTEGKIIAKIGEAFYDFDRLIELVKQRVAERGDDTADNIQMQKAKRSALLVGSFGIVMIFVSAMIAWMTFSEQSAARRLETSGIAGEAEIEDRFLAPNGVTPRLEYRITTADGQSATRNAEVDRPYWDSLEGATTVPVLFVPDEPTISRLATGEPEETDITKKPLVSYGLSVVSALIGLFCLVAGALQWHGWDIDLDSKTGKLSVKRFGTGS